jgi:hypothetical protein
MIEGEFESVPLIVTQCGVWAAERVDEPDFDGTVGGVHCRDGHGQRYRDEKLLFHRYPQRSQVLICAF